ncbi:hypothetical protein GS8_1119 [Geobacillus stearothermophilus]|uniref:Uncharacterized protein n=1 Tax=Geobacillus stearothermophilus TaxID=1422 RepID=A0ABQ7HH55_GEOSE|nr:hypothetical protein GS8_1119 [Geobacillus stearothermophilus]
MDQLMGMTLHQSLYIVLNPFRAMEMPELFILSLFIFFLLLDLLNVWMWKRKTKRLDQQPVEKRGRCPKSNGTPFLFIGRYLFCICSQ